MPTKIEWADEVWNPVAGCTKITAGCDNCYAERIAERFRGVAGSAYENGFDLTLRPHLLDRPSRWKHPRMVFVNSMSDLFHKDVPRDFIDHVFDTMEKTTRHTFQMLTKRSSLMRDYLAQRYRDVSPPTNVWVGVSVEDATAGARIAHLRAAPAAIRFLSIEPLIGPVGRLDLGGIHWVIVGGESGPRRRPMHADWARDVRDQCASRGVPFFFKQWGGARPKSGGRLLDGREWNGWPADGAVDALGAGAYIAVMPRSPAGS